MSGKEPLENEPEEFPEDSSPFVILNTADPGADPLRKIGLYGPINEENCADVVYSLFTFWDKEKKNNGEGRRAGRNCYLHSRRRRCRDVWRL